MESNHGIQPARRIRKNNQTHPVTVSVVSAVYVDSYTIRVTFSDRTERDIDFTRPFAKLKGYYAQYREPALFRSFIIDGGNLVWGADWDVIFPLWSLYTGSIAR
ncbi:MAG: DUF2442 domain-containing protein [Cytophagales bacterium]|nr:MAG: DUF2442 domain-containing protein [Cytophagales bacterium]